MNPKHNNTLSNPGKRQFLAGLTAIAGTVVATTLLSDKAIAAALAYQPVEGSQNSQRKVFSAEQLATLEQLCDVIIPATDTPGAADVDCHGFVDDQLYHCYPKTDWHKARSVLMLVDHSAVKTHHKVFVQLSESQQQQLLTQLDLAQGRFTTAQTTDFKWLKALICFGYFTSQVGASQALNYQAVPNGYQPIVMDASNDKNWGSLAYY